MSLVNIQSVLRLALQKLENMSPPSGLELLSYKRNRTIAVTVAGHEKYMVRERGYVEQEVTVHLNELPRVLKTMIKREFPRSRKVRVYTFTDPAELDREKNRI